MVYRWWKGARKGHRQKEAILELELLVRRAIDEIDDNSRSNSCEGFRQPAMVLAQCTRQCIARVTLLTSPLLEPQQSRLSHEFGNEVARHQAPETRARKQTKNSSLSSQGILNTARDVQRPATPPPTTPNTSNQFDRN